MKLVSCSRARAGLGAAASPARAALSLLPLLSLLVLAPASAARAGDAATIGQGSAEGADVIWTDPVLLFDRNLAHGASFKQDTLILSTHTLPVATLSMLGCDVSHQIGRRDLFIARCDARHSARDRVATLWGAGVWSEVAYIEQEHEDVDPEAAYDLSPAQWHHVNTGQEIDGVDGVDGADIDSVAAWKIAPGATPGPLIAIIDSGIAHDHEDLGHMIWVNEAEVCDNQRDDDGNGYVDDCYGWDIGEQDPDPHPKTLPEKKASGSTCLSWHGTFMAGLMAADGENGVGVSGVNWGAKIINLKKHPDDDCTSSTSESIEAAAYALDAGAKIMVLSFSTSAASRNFRELLTEADEAGVLTFMSAGNSGEDIDLAERYPAYYDLENKVVVAYTGNQDALSSKSNYGAVRVDLAAPGVDLYSTSPDGGYSEHSGSSYATPLVGGVASLTWALFPELPAASVKLAVLAGAQRLDSLACVDDAPECVRTGSRLDALGALEAAAAISGGPDISVDGLTIADADLDGALSPGERATIAFVLRNHGAPTADLDVTASVLGANAPIALSNELVFAPPLGFGQSLRSDQLSGTFELSLGDACERDAEVALTLQVRDRSDSTGIWVEEARIPLACEVDLDGDGVARPRDCDDADASRHPGVEEVCDGVDNDCDGMTDEVGAVDGLPHYQDLDGDGFGSGAFVLACAATPEFVAVTGDCDDEDPLVFPDDEGQCEPDGQDLERVSPVAESCQAVGARAPSGGELSLVLIGALLGLLRSRRRSTARD